MNTATTTATATPRHGCAGITRSKLEVDECIAIALCDNDRGGHEEPDARHDPARQAADNRFDGCFAHAPMRGEEANRDEHHLQNLTCAQDCVRPRVRSEHAAKDAISRREIRRAKVNPRDENGEISNGPDQDFYRNTL